jgi:hypothetical protein
MPQPTWTILPEDKHILRELLKRKRDLSQHPFMTERAGLWTRHASLDSRRPMILAETGGVIDELIPLNTLRCREDWARQMERGLREMLFRAEQVQDDWVIEPRIEYTWFIETGDYGVQTELVRGSNEGKLGSYHWDPPIRDLDRDFDRLKFRSLAVDRERTFAWRDFLTEHFGDILPVENRGMYWWTSGLTWTAINLIGLEPLMMAMYDNPSGLHRLMAFLRDEFINYIEWFEQEELLPYNNRNDYIGSGSIGYTTELPHIIDTPRMFAKIGDLWGLSESQETVGVSPAMFEEFIFPYQEPVVARYGLSYYGCCEPVHTRFHIIKRLKNLRRVSVSPWCNQDKMVALMGNDYIFCRKPNPTLISTDVFSEDAIREDLRTTLRAAGHIPLELVMKDVHTLREQPWRLGRWVEIAREVCNEFGFEIPDSIPTQ